MPLTRKPAFAMISVGYFQAPFSRLYRLFDKSGNTNIGLPTHNWHPSVPIVFIYKHIPIVNELQQLPWSYPLQSYLQTLHLLVGANATFVYIQYIQQNSLRMESQSEKWITFSRYDASVV